jgi:hypothetical protein
VINCNKPTCSQEKSSTSCSFALEGRGEAEKSRVQQAGWVIRYVHDAFAWHHRARDLGSHKFPTLSMLLAPTL